MREAKRPPARRRGKTAGLPGVGLVLRPFCLFIAGTLCAAALSACGVEHSIRGVAVNGPDASVGAGGPAAGELRVALLGDPTPSLGVGEEYREAGATARGPDGGDISSELVVEGTVNTAQAGDYLVRYTARDGGREAAAVRIVRVHADDPAVHTRRPAGSTAAAMGYWEHLPRAYADDPEAGFPLLVFNHGYGAAADLTSGTPARVLDSVRLSGGPPALLTSRRWDESLPFIVLSPQRPVALDIDPAQLDEFIEYAKSTYNIDASRVYMAGWSQGGYISMLYAVAYPHKVAAVAPISGGFFRGLPQDLCAIGPVPVWAFHGEDDDVIALKGTNGSEAAVAAINGCNPDSPARLTVYPGQGHAVHDRTFSLAGMHTGDPRYDAYDQSVYEWFLSFSLSP